MLAYIDRAPGELEPGPRLALASIRLWAAERRGERCPIWMMREMFARSGCSGALWPTHNFLCWVQSHAVRPIELGCPCCGRAADDEALMLSAMFARDENQARAALMPLVRGEALARAVRCARAVGAELV